MRLYVLCHNKSSQKKAEELCEIWNGTFNHEEMKFHATPLLLLPSPFMESSCYPLLLSDEYQNDWMAHDYVGVVTYSILEKLAMFSQGRISTLNWTSVMQAITQENLSVVGILGVNYIRRGGARLSIIEGSVFQHGLNFYRAWKSLLTSSGFCEADIDRYYLTSCIACNWWIVKPTIFQEYCHFIKRQISIINHNNFLQKLFMLNSHYGDKNTTSEEKMRLFGITEYYPLHPFVFERLLSFYLLTKQIQTKFLHTFSLET